MKNKSHDVLQTFRFAVFYSNQSWWDLSSSMFSSCEVVQNSSGFYANTGG